MKKYWLTLNPDVFVWKKQNKVLVYNSKNHQSFLSENTPDITQICNSLDDLDNLYTIDIEEEQLTDSAIAQWIDNLRRTNSGYLTEQSDTSPRPVSFFPYFKLQDDINHLRWEDKQNIAGKIINYLHEITFFLNGSTGGNNDYYKQIHYPLAANVEVLDGREVIAFVQKCKSSDMLKKINLVGDILNYPNFNILYDYIHKNTSDVNLNLYILATDVDEVFPLFTGDNLAFFEKNVFITEEDCQNTVLSKREIFAHQALNTNFFGKLTVVPDGHVYAGINEETLGTINDRIYDILYNEMDKGTSWRMTRDMKPCSDCVYQFLCPSPSNYELVMGKKNLCNIKL